MELMRGRLPATSLLLAILVLTSVVAPTAASAATSTAGDATPNFTESSSCGTYGTRGPYSIGSSIGSRIYGPFADFFGRRQSEVYSQTTWWQHPNNSISFRVHERTLPAFQAAYAALDTTGYRAYSGAGYVWRNISGSRQMSHHAVGNAIDINPPQNPYTQQTLITNMPPEYVAAWEAAGFCWGGYWRWSKDAMHYTWRGPAADAGQGVRLAPQPALTSAAGFTQKVLDTGVAVPTGASVYAMADRRREGADDLYALVDAAGSVQVQVAGAGSDFGILGVRRTTAAPYGGLLALADANGDGRADLWHFSDSGQITADIYFDGNRFRTVGRSIASGATWGPDVEIGLAVYDYEDWLPDLYVINRATGHVDVYSSSSGFTDLIHSSTLPVAPGDDHIVLADRSDPRDGTADVWLVDQGSSATVRVIRYSTTHGYSGLGSSSDDLTHVTGMTVAADSTVMPGDYDGDGRLDLYLLSGNRLTVWLGGTLDYRSLSQIDDWFKSDPDDPITFDAGPECVGECDTIGYVDGSGSWRLAHETAWAPEETNFYYGVPGDEPFMGDWDCDGIDTPGLYRRSDGYVYLRNSNDAGFGDISYFFGIPGDIPLAGDFDGDGCDTVSIYRPHEARFYIINELGSGDSGLGNADFSFLFGDRGDKPFAGDFDGNGVDEIGLHRESTGRVYMRLSLTTGVADLDYIYGIPDDFLVAGDWNGDGVDTPAIFRPSDGNWYVRMENSPGFADHVIPFGLSNRGYLPVAGKTLLEPPGIGLLDACENCFRPAEYEPIEDH